MAKSNKEPSPDPFLCSGCIDGSHFLEESTGTASVEYLKSQLAEAHSELRFRKAQARVSREIGERKAFKHGASYLAELVEYLEDQMATVQRNPIGKAASRAAIGIVEEFIVRAKNKGAEQYGPEDENA